MKNDEITIQMLRAFVSISKTGSPTDSAQELGITRQSVARHLRSLEEITETEYFARRGREYVLNDQGHSALEEISFLLNRLDKWSGRFETALTTVNGLQRKRFVDSDQRIFITQQHPLHRVTTMHPLFGDCLNAWTSAGMDLEHTALQPLRPYLVVLRKRANTWSFVEIGEESAYAKWFGWAWSKSVIGNPVTDASFGPEYDDFIYDDYKQVLDETGLRLDDIYAHLTNADGELQEVSFSRMLLGCLFPDGTRGLIVLAIPSDAIEIDETPSKGGRLRLLNSEK
jgi:hypothetical protein